MMKKKTRTRTKGQGNLFKDARSPYWQLSYWNGWRQVRESCDGPHFLDTKPSGS